MSYLKSKEQLTRIMEYLENVYWKEIDINNPMYLEILNNLKKSCETYNISYETNIKKIYEKFMQNNNIKYMTLLELLNMIELDLKKCNTLEIVDIMENKYKALVEIYRSSIANYITNDSELMSLLNDEIEEEIDRLKNFPKLEERLKTNKVIVCDEDGWPITDENGNEMFRLETKEETDSRIIRENNEYNQIELNIKNLKTNLSKWTEYILLLPYISTVYKNLIDACNTTISLEKDLMLRDYKSNTNFIEDLNNIMNHDTNEYEYLYHGTSCIEDAESIMTNGLYMASDNLENTTYSEFSLDQLLLYNRGFAGEIGRDAIVIIKKPKESNIVKEINEENVSVTQSGLGGISKMKYIIPKEYIVGYVNKRDKKVIYNKDFEIGKSMI